MLLKLPFGSSSFSWKVEKATPKFREEKQHEISPVVALLFARARYVWGILFCFWRCDCLMWALPPVSNVKSDKGDLGVISVCELCWRAAQWVRGTGVLPQSKPERISPSRLLALPDSPCGNPAAMSSFSSCVCLVDWAGVNFWVAWELLGAEPDPSLMLAF